MKNLKSGFKPSAYTQLYIQLVFAVKNRNALLDKAFRPRVFEFMAGVIKTLRHKVIIINGVEDHVHIFLGFNPVLSISETVHEIKRCSSIFINENKLAREIFHWQEGYGAFSYSKEAVKNVYQYIDRQEQHHQKQSFYKEYLEYLKEYEITYDERYLFNFHYNSEQSLKGDE